MVDAKIVGEVIKSYREEKNLSQEVLSGLADIARSHLSMIERGTRKPTLETLFKLCDALEVRPSQVVEEISYRQEEGQRRMQKRSVG